jgi:arsenate reductase
MIAKIYHNTRCSKSRATLAILEQNNVEFEIVNYLENPPSESELRLVLQDLGIGARDLIRKGESAYKDLQLSNKSLTEDELIKAMLNYPILIERPIVRTTKGVVIGRPPENVQNIL